MMKYIALILVVCMVCGCTASSTAQIFTRAYQDLPLKASELPDIDLDSVDSFEKFKTFADSANALIAILNEQKGMFDIPKITVTRENWERASNFIEKYSPLIGSYKEVVSSAKLYKEMRDDETLKKFYMESGKFALEMALINSVILHGFSYEVVGTIYRLSGLSHLALKCPSCVSYALSGAYWTLKNSLVKEGSKFIDYAFALFEK